MDNSLHFAERIFFPWTKKKKNNNEGCIQRHIKPNSYELKGFVLLLLLLLSRNLNLVHGEWALDQFATFARYFESGSYKIPCVSHLVFTDFQTGFVIFTCSLVPNHITLLFDVGSWGEEISFLWNSSKILPRNSIPVHPLRTESAVVHSFDRQSTN